MNLLSRLIPDQILPIEINSMDPVLLEKLSSLFWLRDIPKIE
jgi:hypothetical protein